MTATQRPHERMPATYRLVIWVLVATLAALVAIPILEAIAPILDAASGMSEATG